MEVKDEIAQVQKAIRARPNDFEASDIRPLRRRRRDPPSPLPISRRTVFQPGTDWKALSTDTVLDAIHLSCARQANEVEAYKGSLLLSRCAGSVAVHGSMADLFDTQVTVPTQVEAQEAPLVQCTSCGRPLLLTRFLAHLETCSTRIAEGKVSHQPHAKEDLQMKIICAPYGDEEEGDAIYSGNKSNAYSTFSVQVREMAVEEKKKRAIDDRDTEQEEREAQDALSFPMEEDNWEMTLTSLAPSYVPRGFSARRRRVALPSSVEPSSQKKKNKNVEKRSLEAAVAAGVMPIQHGLGNNTQCNVEGDPLTLLAKELGERAPWSNLMQVAMPVALPRNPNTKKVTSPHDLPSTQLYVSATGKVLGAVSRATKPRNAENLERHVNSFSTPTPSLVGSLLWIRAKGLKELSNTVLYNIDTPQAPVGRTGAIFHGQTYVAELGTFETDPRSQTTIKMPLTTGVTPHLSGKAANGSTLPPKNQGANENRLKKLQGASQVSLQAPNGTASQPLSKKQRTTKAQRASSSGHGAQAHVGGIHVKPGQVSSRKLSASARASAVLPNVNVKSGTSSIDSQHRAPGSRHSLPLTPDNGGSATMVNASAAATKYATQHAHQKKGFRQAVGSMGVPARAVQGGLPAGSILHMAGKGNNRGSKTRPFPSQGASTPSPSMRTAGNKVAKTPSPSQGSSRSGERIPIHRGSPMSAAQFDTVLMGSMAASGNAVNSTLNRAPGSRGGSGNPQLDFQQVLAQTAGHGVINASRDVPGASGPRGMHQGPSQGQVLGVDKFAGQMQRGGVHGIPPQARAKQNVSAQNSQQRLLGGHKNNRGQVRGMGRKDGRDMQQKASDMEAQLRRAGPGANEMVARKGSNVTPPTVYGNHVDHSNIAVNHAGIHPSRGLYTAALAAASAQHGSNTAMKNQANLPLYRMAQPPQNNVGPGAGVAPNMLQSMPDMRPLQNLGVVSGMQGSSHNARVLSFLQASALSGAMPMGGAPPLSGAMPMSTGMSQTGSMSNVGGGGIPAAAIPTPGNGGMLSTGDAILQQLFSAGRGTGLMPNGGGLHGQVMGQSAPQLGQPHGHQVGRTTGMTAMPRPVTPTAPHAAIDEIDRALGLSFDESDLQG